MLASELPKLIQRYRVLSELGRGSMGRVYLASDPNIERRIALKVLTPERLKGEGGEELRQRFLQEARAAGGLSHRGIVTIYDADTDPESGCPYLAMEWVRGCSLKALLHREGAIAPARAVLLITQVARALDYAHRREVVHRDVKPANLLVSGGDCRLNAGQAESRPEEGQRECVKVVDFGIAKLISKSLTQPGRVLGSPYYMAPEQVRGLQVDGRTDLFSLGAVLYECLTGRVAFGGENVANVTHKILTASPRPIDNPDVPMSLRAVVRRALEKLPRDRYRTGAELAAALETVSAELMLGHGIGAVSVSVDTSGTTTEVMSGPSLVNPPVDVEPMSSASSWHWSRRLALVALAFVGLLALAGEQVSRSLDPEILDVADLGGRPVTGLEVESTEDDAPLAAMQEENRSQVPDDQVSEDPGEESMARRNSPAVMTASHLDSVGSLEEAKSLVMHSPLLVDLWAWPAMLSPPSPASVTTNLEIIHQNRLKLAYLSVWIDSERVLLVKLEAKNPFKRIKGREHRWLIPVPVGERSLEVRISSPSKQLEAP